MVTKVTRYQLIELQLTTNYGAGQRLYFQDQPQLRTQTDQLVKIHSIDCFNADAVPKSPSGIATATAADIANGFLVLNIKGTEQQQYIPLPTLNRVQTPAAGAFVFDQFMLEGVFNIDWTKSYVQFADAQTGNISFLFGVNYEYVPLTQIM